MQVVFRVDASASIGGGHIMRCLSLANALTDAGWDCGFACNEEALDMARGLRRHEILKVSAAEPATAAMMERWPKPWTLAVVDHYGLGEEFERSLRPRARRVIVVDDVNTRRHDCDVLLDQTLDRTEDDYRGLVPSGCQYLLGPMYAMLRPEFAEARFERLKRKTNSRLTRVVVGFGASDPHNLSLRALEAIRRTGLELTVDVIVGAGSPHVRELQESAETMAQTVNIYVDPVNIAELLSNADLAIGGAGVSAWERCCVGLPTLMGIMAENQRDVGVAIERRGAAKLLKRPLEFRVSDLLEGILQVAAAPSQLTDMSKAASAICDGRGVYRVIMALLPPQLTPSGRRVSLRFATFDDTAPMLAWRNDQETRRNSRNPALVRLEEHAEWVKQTIEDPSRYLMIILCDGRPAGVLRLDRIDRRDPDSMEISIGVAPELRSQGIATAALQTCHRLCARQRLLGEVLPGNVASHALFRRAGYRQKSETIYVREPLARMNA